MIGRRIVDVEQGGESRATYGAAIMRRLAIDLSARGFSRRNLEQMRQFYLGWPMAQTPSALSRFAPGPFPLHVHSN